MPEPPQPLPVAEPRLATDGLVLRAWNLGDLPELVAAGVDPTVRCFRYSIPRSDTQAHAWLKLRTDREAGRRVELAIAAATDLAAIGGTHRGRRRDGEPLAVGREASGPFRTSWVCLDTLPRATWMPARRAGIRALRNAGAVGA